MFDNELVHTAVQVPSTCQVKLYTNICNSKCTLIVNIHIYIYIYMYIYIIVSSTLIYMSKNADVRKTWPT